MGHSTNRLVSTVLFLCLILVSYNHCLGPTASNKKSAMTYNTADGNPLIDPIDGAGSGSGTGGDTGAPVDGTSVSIQAFSTTVYPLTRVNCVNCHGSFQTPLHAVANVTQAHDAVLNSYKINFDNIPSSRMVAKLRDEAHNCWSADCNADATQMEQAIQNWKAQIDAVTDPGTTEPEPSPGLVTNESNVLIDELDPENAMDSGTLVIEASSASLKAPMVTATAGDLTYIHVPNGNGGLLANNNNAAGAGYLTFDNSMSDNYKVYALVDAPNGQDNSFHIKIDNGAYQEWHIEQTNGFEWREVTNTANMNPVQFFVPAGNGHVLEVRQREDGTKISRVVVSNDPNVNLNDISNAVIATISYDISAIVGTTAFFTIDIQEYDMYSYKLSNPTITSSSRIRIKNIKPLINGSYNPQHATYTLVDTTTLGGTTILSPRALIALKDQGAMMDRLSFSFEILQQQ